MSDHDFEDYDRFHVMEDFDSYHLTEVEIGLWESDIEILDALKNNTVVKKVFIELHPNYRPEGQEVLAKLSEVMQCNTSVETLMIRIQRGLLGERTRLFASMATSGGWSSIKQLVLKSEDDDDDYDVLSLRDTEQISSFIMQSDNLRALTLDVPTVQAEPMIEALSRTKVQSLDVHFRSTSDLQNGARRLATALERCTCITQLKLEFPRYNDEVEFIQILLVESIPKMLGLKKLELEMYPHLDEQFFDMVGRCIGGHQGEIEELRLRFLVSSVNISIAGLAPALRRLKVIGFHYDTALTSTQIHELSAVVADCDTLEEFDYNLVRISDDDFKAICQLLSKFPSLKRVLQNRRDSVGLESVDLGEESRFVAFLEMVKTSKTIEQVPSILGKAEKEAAIKHHCHNNRMHNQIELIREKGLLGATVPSSAWPLILKEFSDMPDVILYLMQQKHGALIGPTCHGCKQKQGVD
jgi:hypothetical protein